MGIAQGAARCAESAVENNCRGFLHNVSDNADTPRRTHGRMSTFAMSLVRAAAPVVMSKSRFNPSSRCGTYGRTVSRRRQVVAMAQEQPADTLNSGQTKSQLTPNAPGADTPENILRVSRGTSFEGLKSAYRMALEAAGELEDPDEKAKKVEKVEWAFDELIAESRNFFLKQVKDNQADANAVFRLGNFYQTLGKLDEAEEQYRKATGLDGNHVDAMNNLALVLQQIGKIDEAEAYYLKCVSVDDKCVDVMFNWATLKLEHRQDLDGCRVLINQIVQINPELKEHKLVKALRGDYDEEGETFG